MNKALLMAAMPGDLKDGSRLFVGKKDGDDGLLVETRGARGFDSEDAYRMMLARVSAGADSCKPEGTKKAMAEMWAAAKLLGLEVNGYEPDAYALEARKRMENSYKEARQ